MGKLRMRDALVKPVKDQSSRLFHWLSITLSLRRTSQESINLESHIWIVPRIRFVWGRNFGRVMYLTSWRRWTHQKSTRKDTLRKRWYFTKKKENLFSNRRSKFWERNRQYSFCLWIPWTRITRILLRSTWVYRVMHNTCIKHGRNIRTQYIGLTSILLLRKDWNSIRLDRMQSSFKHPSKMIGWKNWIRNSLEARKTRTNPTKTKNPIIKNGETRKWTRVHQGGGARHWLRNNRLVTCNCERSRTFPSSKVRQKKNRKSSSSRTTSSRLAAEWRLQPIQQQYEGDDPWIGQCRVIRVVRNCTKSSMFPLSSLLESRKCLLHLRTILDLQRIQKKV